MVEEAVAERLDADFAFYGGQGIAECVDGGELEFDAAAWAETDAKYDAESIEFASRAHAGIGEFDDWPDGVTRPSASDSYVTVHQGVEYVVLRRRRTVLAVYSVADGRCTALDSWRRRFRHGKRTGTRSGTMGSLKNTVLRLGGVFVTAGGITVTGRTGIILALVLIVLAFTLIAVLALTGTFGSDRHQEAAQAVLAILLGRTCLGPTDR